jgi:hypothetical protein
MEQSLTKDITNFHDLYSKSIEFHKAINTFHARNRIALQHTAYTLKEREDVYFTPLRDGAEVISKEQRRELEDTWNNLKQSYKSEINRAKGQLLSSVIKMLVEISSYTDDDLVNLIQYYLFEILRTRDVEFIEEEVFKKVNWIVAGNKKRGVIKKVQEDEDLLSTSHSELVAKYVAIKTERDKLWEEVGKWKFTYGKNHPDEADDHQTWLDDEKDKQWKAKQNNFFKVAMSRDSSI